ncbi:hypothetical protein QJS66_05565 [Kocuria rhizophila]|nr:hypothetical protein QJS66_05565 [Kocuria rhizophila]
MLLKSSNTAGLPTTWATASPAQLRLERDQEGWPDDCQLLMAAGARSRLLDLGDTSLLIKVLARRRLAAASVTTAPPRTRPSAARPRSAAWAVPALGAWPRTGDPPDQRRESDHRRWRGGLRATLALASCLAWGSWGFLDGLQRSPEAAETWGLTPAGKMVLRGAIGSAFAVLVLFFPGGAGSARPPQQIPGPVTPGSTSRSRGRSSACCCSSSG